MKLPFVDKVAKRFTQTASEQVKREAKKTAIDLLPGILAFGGMIFSIFAFREVHNTDDSSAAMQKPYASSTHITTNNYFLGDVSEDIIKKILEERR